MTLRTTILIMSAFGVISDSILIAFYPQFFQARYGLTSSVHVGAYIAAISIAVMCMLPVWARVNRHVETMHLLVYTQFVAASLCVAAAWAPNVESYWALTLLMFMTKASYLLMFPYLMRLEKPENHSITMGLLSVVIHIGAIFGAAVGGLALQEYGPRFCLWLMAAGDFAQMALCIYLIRRGKVVRVLSASLADRKAVLPKRTAGSLSVLLKLCLLMLLFDFSAYLVRPFFSVYWEATSGIHQQMLTGVVFAIPGMVALVALLIKHRMKRTPRLMEHTLGNLLLGAVGLALQATPSLPLIIIGRCLYGWAMYQVIIKLEVTLFKVSTPDAYARDFSVTNFFQNLGVLLSSFSAGFLVSLVGIPTTFLIAACGMLLVAAIDRGFFGVDRRHAETGELSHAS
ncbi:MAG TPA: MFS transporter [Pseudomonas xinjiangensis]|uniref:MFS transporter n=2 Tax=root TaxID=1 RepID=A0A7V1FSL0_9GAMM|nr:MFS transporter [Halopseudomonas xinjiangensis]HEC46302.1 MFS transporter [Halopseudomonas xinjiangensis]